MSASQRRKGHDWEREVARLFRDRLNLPARRGLQSRDGSAEVPDVEVPYFSVECKVGSRPDIWAALDQAEAGGDETRWPVAVCKRDRSQPIVAMRLEDWLELVGLWLREVTHP